MRSARCRCLLGEVMRACSARSSVRFTACCSTIPYDQSTDCCSANSRVNACTGCLARSKRLVAPCTTIDTSAAHAKLNHTPLCGNIVAVTAKNAANEPRPITMPRINHATKSAPCARWADTASTMPSKGNTDSSPLHVAPIDADSVVTATVSSAPASMRSARSPSRTRAAGTWPVTRGKPLCETATATQPAATAHISPAGKCVSNTATPTHPSMPAVSASGHAERRQVHAYAKLNASDAAIAAIDAADACAANAGPRSSASSNTIGPATPGSPASHPATDGPHTRPATVNAARNAGTSASLSASNMLTLPSGVRYDGRAPATTLRPAYRAQPRATAEQMPAPCPTDK